MNFAQIVEERAHRAPDSVAIRYPSGNDYLQYTNQELLDASSQIAAGLCAMGFERGTRTVLMVKPSLEFFALAFALVRAGIVPIVVDPGMGMRNLKICLREAEPQAFVGIPTAHVARMLFRWAPGSQLVTVGTRLGWGGATLDEVKTHGHNQPFETVQTEDDETLLIVFTSGSTGIPKGVIYSHANLTAQVDLIKQHYGITPGEGDLPTFPVFALFDPFLGMTTTIPQMDFTRPGRVNPPNVIEPVQKFQITNMFGAPALLKRVGQYGVENNVKLPSLQRIIAAGAPVPASTMADFRQILNDDVQIFSSYGATEGLPVAFIGSHEVLDETWAKTEQGAGVCVGHPVEGVTVHIIGITDNPIAQWEDGLKLPTGEIGEIVVQGPNISRAYYNRPTANALAKIPDGDNFYHRMGDVGYFDAEGRLWFCGRKAHRVITDQGTLFTIPCEAIFNTHPQVARTALVGVKGKPVLCVELEKSAQSSPELTQALLRIGAEHDQTQSIKTILYYRGRFPVDVRHNSKIFREKLAVWAEKQR